LLGASPSQAGQPLDLSWQAPLGCPQESAVREQIRALVPSAMLESGSLKAEGTITRVDKRFRLNLVLHLGEISGERSIDSDSCSDLAGAAAVAVGLLLQSATQSAGDEPSTTSGASSGSEPGAAGSQTPENPDSPRSPKPSDVTASAPAPETQPVATLTDRSARPRSWRVFLQAPQLGFDVGPLPKPSFGLVVAAGFSVQQWRFAASLELPRSQHLGLPGESRAGAELQHWAVESWTCRGWRSGRLELAPCLLIGLDWLRANGVGAGVTGRSARASWLSVGAAALGRWYVADWLALTASAGAKVEGARPTISIDGLSESGRLEPAALTFRAGPVWIF